MRVVLDSQERLPTSLEMFNDGAASTWHLTSKGLKLDPAARIDPRTALAYLANQGITRVLVEGGGQLAASLFKADLVDRIAWFRAPSLIGADGLPGVADLSVSRIADMRRFARIEMRQLGDDMLETYARL